MANAAATPPVPPVPPPAAATAAKAHAKHFVHEIGEELLAGLLAGSVMASIRALTVWWGKHAAHHIVEKTTKSAMAERCAIIHDMQVMHKANPNDTVNLMRWMNMDTERFMRTMSELPATKKAGRQDALRTFNSLSDAEFQTVMRALENHALLDLLRQFRTGFQTVLAVIKPHAVDFIAAIETFSRTHTPAVRRATRRLKNR